MADITVTCTNDKNVSIAFRWDWDNNPFHLLGLDGIYGYDCNVTTSENTTTDGSTYQGSTAKERNIVITAEIDGDYRKNRELLYRVFPKGRTGTLESQMGFYVTEAGEYTVEADLESVMVTPKAFKVTNDNLMTTQNITLREGSNMGYIGNYIGSFIAQ